MYNIQWNYSCYRSKDLGRTPAAWSGEDGTLEKEKGEGWVGSNLSSHSWKKSVCIGVVVMGGNSDRPRHTLINTHMCMCPRGRGIVKRGAKKYSRLLHHLLIFGRVFEFFPVVPTFGLLCSPVSEGRSKVLHGLNIIHPGIPLLQCWGS